LHSADFGGSFALEKFAQGTSVDRNDGLLTCAINDKIVVT
jgi:hypothetical protein